MHHKCTLHMHFNVNCNAETQKIPIIKAQKTELQTWEFKLLDAKNTLNRKLSM